MECAPFAAQSTTTDPPGATIYSAILRETTDIQAATRTLIEAALAAGGPDNVTVVVAERSSPAARA